VSIRGRGAKGDEIGLERAGRAAGRGAAVAPGKSTLVESSFAQPAPGAGAPSKRTLVESLPVAPPGGLLHENEAGALMVGQRAGAPTGPSIAGASSSVPRSSSPASSVSHVAIDRAVALAKLGRAHLGAIESALVPAYRQAVGAMDTAAVTALALQIVGGVARIVDAQGQIVQLVPQVDTGPQAAHASTAATDPGPVDPGAIEALAAQKAALDAAVLATVPRLAVQVSPQWFGDQLLAGRVPEPAPHVREVLVQLTYEAGLVVQLLEEADSIVALVNPTSEAQQTSEPTTDDARKEAVERLAKWKGRPINFMFLQRALTRRGVWQVLQGVKDGRGRTAADLERKVFAQSKETGTTADVGEDWDANEAHDALSVGTTDWKVTDDEGTQVFDMLAKAEPRARGELVKQLYRMGRLGPMCEHVPWAMVKQLWESIADPVASKLLEPYWATKGGGASLGKRLEAQDHWYTRGLSRFLDIATFGAKPRIDAAYDAREAGLATDDEYWGGVTKAVGRAAFAGAAAAATGGLAGELVGGAAEGVGLAGASIGRVAVGRVAAAGMSGAVGGGVGNVAGHLVGDVYDQVLDGKQGFDSLSAYGHSFTQGAALGGALGVTAGVGLAASPYLARSMRTVAQDAAAAHPRITRLLEAARSVGKGAGHRIRTTAGELAKWFGDGGPPPGLRLAYASTGGGPVLSRIAKAPQDAPMWITVRPLVDLNARPMQMEAPRDLVEIELGEEISEMFGELSSHDDIGPGQATGESSQVGERGPEVEAMGVRGQRQAGVVAEPGGQAVDQHHVFPQAPRFAKWFADRGIDVHDYCIELTPTEHQAQHGGGDWRLARKVAREIPEAEWSEAIMKRLTARELRKQQRFSGDPSLKLSREEVIEEGLEFMKRRGLEGARFVRYKGGTR
jgi:Predicted lipoprotein of unknown function (DUF2380)